VKEQLYEIHFVLNYTFSISYTPSVSNVTNYSVTVFYEDHGLNNVLKTVHIRVNP
jgi:hypothetical protein